MMLVAICMESEVPLMVHRRSGEVPEWVPEKKEGKEGEGEGGGGGGGRERKNIYGSG